MVGTLPSSSVVSPQRDATFWVDIIDEFGLDIGNDDQPTLHWMRDGEEGESILNLTLATPPIKR